MAARNFSVRKGVHPKGGSPMVDYAFNGESVDVFVLMLSHLPNGVNETDSHGCTWLHKMIDSDPLEHVESFESYPDDIFVIRVDYDYHNNRHIFSRHLASSSYFLDDVLGSGIVSVDQVRSLSFVCGVSSLFLAISTERHETSEALIKFDPDSLDTISDDQGRSPLELATRIHKPRRSIPIMETILERKPESAPSVLGLAATLEYGFNAQDKVSVLLERPNFDKSWIFSLEHSGKPPLLLATESHDRAIFSDML
jgi:hypothetical protein